MDKHDELALKIARETHIIGHTFAPVGDEVINFVRLLRAEWEREVERDAARWRYLKSATGETPLRPAAYGAEFPDIRLRFDFPTIVSYDAVGNQIELDDAIDAAIAAREGE